MDPLVSILIPVYNREHLVGETIESAINQTYKNIEIIIVDNYSTDNTWQVLEHYAALDNRIRLFRNKKNIGPVRNWRRCIEEAKGEYAKILFSDDLISADFIEETLKLFDSSVAFVLATIKVFGKGNNNLINNYNGLNDITVQRYFENILLIGKYLFPVSPGCALFRTTDMVKSLKINIANPFGLDFNKYGAGNDLLLFLYTANKYARIGISKKTTAYFRSHNESFSIANQLNTYYEYAKFHFLLNHHPELLRKYKAVIWFRKNRKLTDDKIYNLIKGKIDWFFLFKQLLKRKLFQISTKQINNQ